MVPGNKFPGRFWGEHRVRWGGFQLRSAARAAPMAPAKSPRAAGTMRTAWACGRHSMWVRWGAGGAERPPFVGGGGGGGGGEGGAAGGGDATADDDDLGVEGVDERGDGGGEIADGGEPDCGGGGVAGFVRGDEVAGSGEAAGA